jgi:hypothetical protein
MSAMRFSREGFVIGHRGLLAGLERVTTQVKLLELSSRVAYLSVYGAVVQT